MPLEIIAEDPEVASWPWEYVFDPNNKSFISRKLVGKVRNEISYEIDSARRYLVI